MIGGLLKKMYGDFSQEELKKYLLLGVTLSLIIGVYWTIRPLKDAFFLQLVVGLGTGGKSALLGWAKIFSMSLLFPIVMFYSKLVDKFRKHNLLYLLGTTYVILMFAWALFFLHPTLGLANLNASTWRISGWLWYVFVESFGSLYVALFWAFTTDISNPQSAKRGFALIYMIAQIGGILFPFSLPRLPGMLDTTNWITVAICGILVGLTILMVRYFVKTTPKEVLEGYKGHGTVEKGEEEPGFLEGLKLLVSHKYLLGLFGAVAIFEIMATFIDFNFKALVGQTITNPIETAKYLGDYGASVNLLTFIFLLLGANNIQRFLGIRTALVLVPVIISGFSIALYFFSGLLPILFYLMIGTKAVNYALNGPNLKQLYVPTTDGVKYKAQAWIETFGSRMAKASSSSVNAAKGLLGNQYILTLTALALGFGSLWILIAFYLGNTYNKAVKENKYVC